jgi:hypothetical protein
MEIATMKETNKADKPDLDTVGMGVRVKKEIYHRIKIHAAKEDVKPGKIVEKALIEYLNKLEKTAKEARQ